jgi:hypothetical protein
MKRYFERQKMKKRTLNQTWTLCLRMWRWVAKKWAKESSPRKVIRLKRQWLHNNGFEEAIMANCFFCDFQEAIGGCTQCPGKLVDSSFSCCSKVYGYEYKPIEFYKELLRLNRIRKAKK